MSRWIAPLFVALAPALAAAFGPTDAIAAAAKDASTLGPAATETRYLYVHHRTAAQKKLCFQVVAAQVNFLSREPDIVSPVVILDDGTARQWPNIAEVDFAHLVLIRLNCRDYRWDKAVYVDFREQDAFFHVPVIDAEGRSDFYLAPWLAETEVQRQALATLANATQSAVPILRADNFVWQTAIQADRVVGYYSLLGVKNQKDFERLIGFDRKTSEDFTRELLAIADKSGVSRAARRLARFEKTGGAYWLTFDNRVATGQNNPQRVLNDEFRFAASETYGHLANGLWAVGLFDNQGNRQDSAPDFVGGDKHSHNNDARIHIFLSCVRCHVDGGMQDIHDWARRTFRPPTPLQSPDYQAVLDARRKYLRHLEPFLAGDRLRYATALHECNGMTPEAYAAALAKYYASIDRPVSLERAAEDLDTTPEFLVKMLRKNAEKRPDGKDGPGNDTVLAPFARPAKEIETIPLEQWWEALPLAHLALRGLTVWPQQTK